MTRQVVLEAKIVEVELSDAYQAGINWAAVLTQGNRQYFLGQSTPRGGFDGDLLAPPATSRSRSARAIPINGFITNALGGAFTLAADFADFNAFIELLGLQGRTRVLSSPRVSTLHNQKAVIKAGSDEFFVTGVSERHDHGRSRPPPRVDVELTPFFSGVALDVTPQISDQGDGADAHPPDRQRRDRSAERAVGARPDRFAAAGAEPDPRVRQHRARAQRPGHRDRRPDARDAQATRTTRRRSSATSRDSAGCSAASATRPAPRSW